MKNIIIVSALTLLVPAVAGAEEYAKPGQIEAGGFFAVASQTIKTKVDAPGAEETSDTLTAILIEPTIGYFVADGLEVIGQLIVRNVSYKFDGADDPFVFTDIGLGAGAGYFLNLGVARIGPQGIVRFVNDSFTAGDFKNTGTSMGAQVGAFAKVPINSGGVLSAGLVYDYLQVTRSVDDGAGFEYDEEGTDTAIGARVGFLVYF